MFRPTGPWRGERQDATGIGGPQTRPGVYREQRPAICAEVNMIWHPRRETAIERAGRATAKAIGQQPAFMSQGETGIALRPSPCYQERLYFQYTTFDAEWPTRLPPRRAAHGATRRRASVKTARPDLRFAGSSAACARTCGASHRRPNKANVAFPSYGPRLDGSDTTVQFTSSKRRAGRSAAVENLRTHYHGLVPERT